MCVVRQLFVVHHQRALWFRNADVANVDTTVCPLVPQWRVRVHASALRTRAYTGLAIAQASCRGTSDDVRTVGGRERVW
jgi:hypothetical protein